MILAVCAFTHVNARLLLVGQALPEEIAAAGFLQGVICFDGEEFANPLTNPFSSRNAFEIGSGISRLFFDPSARAGRVLVFEPAIRVGDGDTVENLRHRLHG
jgi:hypothetical protein